MLAYSMCPLIRLHKHNARLARFARIFIVTMMVMQLLRRLWSRRRSRSALIFIAVIVVVATSLLFVKRASSTEDYYSERLQRLHAMLQDMPGSFELSGDTDKDLKNYYQQLEAITALCKQIRDKSAALGQKKLNDKLRQSINNADKLCADLGAIAVYQRQLYGTLDVYLTLDLAPNLEPTSPQFGNQVSDIVSTIRNTLRSVRNVDNQKIEDPALSELLAQLEEAEKTAATVQEAMSHNDHEQAKRSMTDLIKLVNQDKSDYLLARNYFWNNTVQLDALLQATEKLQQEFNR